MSKLFHTIPCDCERGGDCSKVTRCCLNETMQELEDQVERDMYEQQDGLNRRFRETAFEYQRAINEQRQTMHEVDAERRRWRMMSLILMLALIVFLGNDAWAQEPPPGFYTDIPQGAAVAVYASWDADLTPQDASDAASICAALSLVMLRSWEGSAVTEEQMERERESFRFWYSRMYVVPESQRRATLIQLATWAQQNIPIAELEQHWMNCAFIEYGERS